MCEKKAELICIESYTNHEKEIDRERVMNN